MNFCKRSVFYIFTFKVNFKDNLDLSEQILNFKLNSLGEWGFFTASIKKELIFEQNLLPIDFCPQNFNTEVMLVWGFSVTRFDYNGA